MKDDNNQTDNNFFSLSKDDYKWLWTFSMRVYYFPTHLMDLCMKENIQDMIKDAEKVTDIDSYKLFYKEYSALFTEHFPVSATIKEIGGKFLYWSNKNILIANILLEFMTLLHPIVAGIERLRMELIRWKGVYLGEVGPQLVNLPEAFEFHGSTMIKEMYAPEIEKKCKYYSTKLAAIVENVPTDETETVATLVTGYPVEPISYPKETTFNFKRRDNYLTDTEANILESLGDDTLKGPELSKKAGYKYNSNFKNILSNLRKRDILDHVTGEGYKRNTDLSQ